MTAQVPYVVELEDPAARGTPPVGFLVHPAIALLGTDSGRAAASPEPIAPAVIARPADEAGSRQQRAAVGATGERWSVAEVVHLGDSCVLVVLAEHVDPSRLLVQPRTSCSAQEARQRLTSVPEGPEAVHDPQVVWQHRFDLLGIGWDELVPRLEQHGLGCKYIKWPWCRPLTSQP